MSGISCKKPEGAFYVFPSCKEILGMQTANNKVINNDKEFASALLEFAGVAIVPGSAFGFENYFRISYAASDENLENACKRIKQFCKNLI